MLDAQAARYGFAVQHLAVPPPGLDQKAIWLRVQVAQPDWVLLRSSGVALVTALKEAATLPHVLAHLTARYKHLKIEVPTIQRLERLAHAVIRTVEDQFFTTLAQALAPAICQQLDALLTEASSSLSLTALKTAVGRRSLPSLEATVAQLQQLQSLILPQELLTPYG